MSSISYKDLVRSGSAGMRKRIIFALPHLRVGGAERVLVTLMNNLDRNLFDPYLITMSEAGTMSEWIGKDIPIANLNQPNINRSIHKLAQQINMMQADIVVSTTSAMNLAILMAKPLLKKPTKIVVRETVSPSAIIEKKTFPWLLKNSYRRLYDRADLVLSPARCIVDDFQNYLNISTQNHAILLNPVDVETIRTRSATLPAIHDERRNTIHFVCAGPLTEQKGYDRLIDAMPGYNTAYNWKLTILGDGPDKQRLEALIAQNGLQDRVILAGQCAKPWPIIAAADAVLLPSRWEGLPNIVLEALCLGTPVIATRETSGIDEIAAHVAPKDLKLADTMESFLYLMEGIQPAPTAQYRPSLLPEAFTVVPVIERFSQLILGQEERTIHPAPDHSEEEQKQIA